MSSSIRFTTLAGVTGFLLAFAPTVCHADKGSAGYSFDGKAKNDGKIKVSLEWTKKVGDKTEKKNQTLTVDVKKDDGDDKVAENVKKAFENDEKVKNDFTASKSSTFGIHYAKLVPKEGAFACTADIMNGVFNDRGDLVDTVQGFSLMSAGVDPSTGDLFFDLLGTSTSGTVSLAADGKVVSTDTAGKPTAAIKSELAAKFSGLGLQASIDVGGRIAIANANVDNLTDLGANGKSGIEAVQGGASSSITDPGLGEMLIATQACPAEPVPALAPWGLAVSALVLCLGGAARLARRRDAHAA
ncbi:MAG: hypothetical protein HY721_11150 [Planctomycetes bacterium]|nr:hypothetical protein [Planctomycetota bacterium]